VSNDNCVITGNGSGRWDIVWLLMDPNAVGAFFPLLQRGVNVPAMVPCNLENFLHEQLGLSMDYISERITTIFVDGKTTDSLDDTEVRDGSTIALSAAMPGVVGATLRRGSFYAAMRSGITSLEVADIATSREGVVCVKLFNLLLTELGPEFLHRGIDIDASELTSLFLDMPDSFREGCREVRINGAIAAKESLQRMDRFLSCADVRLTIEFISESNEIPA